MKMKKIYIKRKWESEKVGKWARPNAFTAHFPTFSLSHFLLFFCLFYFTAAQCQMANQPDLLPTDTMDLSHLTLEDLMKYKSQGLSSDLEAKINSAIEVASVTPLAVRKSPAI